MLYVMHLMLIHKRVHQTMTKKRDNKRVQGYSTTRKGNAKTTFIKPIRRYTSKKRKEK